LPQEVKNALILKRQRNIVSAQIAETNWGKGLDRETRFRIAEWSNNAGIDPATELHVLGGNFYKNAHYYLRRQAELMADGIIEYAYAEHVEHNDELNEMAKRQDDKGQWAREQIDRRAQQRILHKIPPAAASSVVWHIKVRNSPIEFVAAKWCGGGTRKSDPVGDAFPVETSETRAARRAMRLLSEWRPQDGRIRALVEINDDDTIDREIGGTLREGLLRAKADEAKAMVVPKQLTAAPLHDPYGLDTTAPRQPSEPVPVQPAAERSPAIAPTADAMQSPLDPPPKSPPPLAGGDDARPEREPGEEEAIDDTDLLTAEERAEHERIKKAGGR